VLDRLPWGMVPAACAAQSVAATYNMKGAVDWPRAKPMPLMMGGPGPLLTVVFFAASLGGPWRRRLPPYMLLLPDLLLVEGLTVGIGQDLLSFPVGGLFQAISYTYLRPILNYADGWTVREPGLLQ
jgi:hypothetical protein